MRAGDLSGAAGVGQISTFWACLFVQFVHVSRAVGRVNLVALQIISSTTSADSSLRLSQTGISGANCRVSVQLDTNGVTARSTI